MATHEISQMDMAVRVQQYVVRFYVSVYDSLAVYVPQSAAQLGYPEAHGVLREGLPRDVEPQIATAHEIDDKVHVLDVLEAVPQVTNEGMVYVLEHASFANDVSNTLGPYDCKMRF